MSTGAALYTRRSPDFRPLEVEGDAARVPRGRALVINADGTLETVDIDNACGKYVYRDGSCKACGHRVPERRYTVAFAHGESVAPKATEGIFVLVEGNGA